MSLGEVICSLAREYGWTISEIVNGMTYQEILRCYEIVHQNKAQDLQLCTIAISRAVAYGSGHLKDKDWTQFLDALYARPKGTVDTNKTIEEMKRQGFEIEEK